MRPAGSAAAPSLAADEGRLLACVHCGLCLPSCPTYRVLGEENDGPRGRIHLMRALLEGRVDAGGAFATHIGRCLGCRACETACPAGVEYGALLESARADGREAGGGPGARLAATAERFGLWLLVGPPRRPLFAALRTVRDLGLAGWLGRLPGRPGLGARLLAATRPDPALTDATMADDKGPRGEEGSSERPMSGGPRDPEPRTYLLLEGCVMAGLFGHVHGAARRTLADAGYREERAPGQGCCGALHAHAGRLGAARRLARRNLAAFETSGADRIAVDSAGCGAALREYPRWLAGDEDWAAIARRWAGRVRDVTELLARAGPPRGRLPARIAYDAPCHLLHAQGVAREPLELMAGIEDAEVHPLPSWEACCGGAGIYNLLHPRIAGRVLADKLDEIEQGRYGWVATGNPGCLMQVGAGLAARCSPTRAAHPVELLDAARRRSVGPEPTSNRARRERWS